MTPRVGAPLKSDAPCGASSRRTSRRRWRRTAGYGSVRGVGQRSDDEPRNPQAQVDLQVKTMAASECDEEVRAAWRERAVGNRPQAARVRRRVRLERRTCAAARQGTQGEAGP